MYMLQNLEQYMRRTSFRWAANLLLTLIIFFNAQLGNLLGFKELALSISVIWPATGFSLAAILLMGYKAWPGIFFGNFISNFINIHTPTSGMIDPILIGGAISSGSLFQALLGGYIIRAFNSAEYIKNVKDLFILLLPASLMSCMIASTIGIAALSLEGSLPPQNIFYTWFTFWLGDSFGIYIFTPLLIIWLLQKPDVSMKKHLRELPLMLLVFLAISFFCYYWDYPVVHLYIPLAIWATFRFHMHGATIAILLITLVSIVATVMGYGPFIPFFAGNSLLILVSFLAIIVFVSLILGAVLNERERAWKLLHSHNIDLREAVDFHVEELKEMHTEIFIKEKLASLGMLTLGIARQIQPPLHQINTNIKGCIDSLSQVQGSFASEMESMEPGLASLLRENFTSMDAALKDISRLERQVNRVVEVIQEQATRSKPGRVEVKPINLNTLLNICLNQALSECHESCPDFSISVTKHFDRTVKRVSGLPEELAHAFIYLIGNAIESLKEKYDELGDKYNPTLELRTEDFPDKIQIIIKDNGSGISPQQTESFFHSFFSTDPLEEANGLGLLIAHDIIVQVHHGEVTVNSKEGEYSEITLTLPKTPF